MIRIEVNIRSEFGDGAKANPFEEIIYAKKFETLI